MMKKHVDKNCSKCKVLLTEENCASCATILCKPCYNAKMREYFKTYKDKHREIMYAWRKVNKDKVKKMLNDYSVKRFGSSAACIGHYMKKYKENLTDTYVKFTLIQHSEGNLSFKDIPQDLILLKRKQLSLKRKITSYGKD